jgi:hypothetical protein
MLGKAVLLVFGMALSCLTQERFQSGEFKGFTKSPTEHIVISFLVWTNQ